MKHLAGGSASSSDNVVSALSELLPLEGGDLDLQALLGMFTSGNSGLLGLADSWLGDGDNEPLSEKQVVGVFGSDKIAQFAGILGVSDSEATGGLAAMVPELLDKVSSGGSLQQDLIGGALSGLAGKLFS